MDLLWEAGEESLTLWTAPAAVFHQGCRLRQERRYHHHGQLLVGRQILSQARSSLQGLAPFSGLLHLPGAPECPRA